MVRKGEIACYKQFLLFSVSAVQVFLKTLWEKEKLLITSNFSFSHSVFYPFGALSAIFNKIRNCRLPTLNSLEEFKICHLGKGLPAFSPLPTMFSTLCKTNFGCLNSRKIVLNAQCFLSNHY